jgi:hypothetical protein
MLIGQEVPKVLLATVKNTDSRDHFVPRIIPSPLILALIPNRAIYPKISKYPSPHNHSDSWKLLTLCSTHTLPVPLRLRIPPQQLWLHKQHKQSPHQRRRQHTHRHNRSLHANRRIRSIPLRCLKHQHWQQTDLSHPKQQICRSPTLNAIARIRCANEQRGC